VALGAIGRTAGGKLDAKPHSLVLVASAGDGESRGRVIRGSGKHVHTAVRSRRGGDGAALRECRRASHCGEESACRNAQHSFRHGKRSRHFPELIEPVTSSGPPSLCAETETGPFGATPAAEAVQLTLDLPST